MATDPYSINKRKPEYLSGLPDYSAPTMTGTTPAAPREVKSSVIRRSTPVVQPATTPREVKSSVAPALGLAGIGRPVEKNTLDMLGYSPSYLPRRTNTADPTPEPTGMTPAQMSASTAPAAAKPQSDDQEIEAPRSQYNFSTSNGAVISAMSDYEKGQMRREQFMRDLGSAKFASARRAIADAYVGNERNIAEGEQAKLASQTRLGEAAMNNVANVGMKSGELSLGAQKANAETRLARRELDLSERELDFKMKPQPMSAKDLLDMEKTRLEMEKLKDDQSMKREQFEAGIVDLEDKPFNEAVKRRMAADKNLTYEQAAAEVDAENVLAGNDPRRTTSGRARENARNLTAAERLNRRTSGLYDGVFGGTFSGGDNATLSDDELANFRYTDLVEADVGGLGRFVNGARRLIGQPAVRRLEYPVDAPEGMERPHILVDENDPIYTSIRRSKQIPDSGR